MAIALRGHNSGSDTVATANHVVTPPVTPNSGDVLVVCLLIHVNVARTITLPSGWSLVTDATDNAGFANQQLFTFVKVAGGSEPSTYTFTQTVATNTSDWLCEVFSGVASSGTVNASNDASITATSGATPAVAVTTTVANCTLVHYGSIRNGAGGTWTPNSGFTELDQVDAGTGDNLAGFYKLNQASGATGNIIATCSNNGAERAAALIALAPTTVANVTGAAALAGSGTLGSAGLGTALAADAVAGSGALGAAGAQTAFGAVALSGSGTLTAAGVGTAFGAVALGDVFDSFTRADSANVGNGWLTLGGAIASNQLQLINGTAVPQRNGIGDALIEFSVWFSSWNTGAAASDVYVALDSHRAPPGWQLVAQVDGTVYLRDTTHVVGTWSVAAPTSSGAAVKLGLELSGTHAAVYINDVLVGRFTDSSITSGSTFLSSVANAVGAATDARFDNFRVATSSKLSADGSATALGAVALSGTGTLTAAGLASALGAAAVAGSGVLAAAGLATTFGSASIIGSGSLVAAGAETAVAASAPRGTGTLAVAAVKTAFGRAALGDFLDDFNRPDSADIDNGWTVGPASIVSNQLQLLIGANDAGGVIPPGGAVFADGRAEVLLWFASWDTGSAGSVYAGINAHLLSVGWSLFAQPDGTVYLRDSTHVVGTWSVAPPTSLGAAVKIALELTGSDAAAYVDDVLVGRFTDASITTGFTYLAAGAGPSAPTDVRLDDFRLATSSRLTADGLESTVGAAVLSGAGALAADGYGSTTGASSLLGNGALSDAGMVTRFGDAALGGTGTLGAATLAAILGAAALAGTGTLASIGDVDAVASSDLAGAGAVAADGLQTTSASVPASGTGSLAADGLQSVTDDAALTGRGILTADGLQGAYATSTMASNGALAASGAAVAYGASAASGAGVLAAAGAPGRPGAASLSGTATLAADGSTMTTGAAHLAGSGALTCAGRQDSSGAADLRGNSSLSDAGVVTRYGDASVAGAGTLTADGARLVVAAAHLTGAGTLGADPGPADALASCHLAGIGLMAPEGLQTALGASVLAATGVLGVSGLQRASGASGLAGAGALGAAGEYRRLAVVHLSATSELAADGLAFAAAGAIMAGTAGLTSAGLAVVYASLALLGDGDFAAAVRSYLHLGSADLVGETGAAVLTTRREAGLGAGAEARIVPSGWGATL